MSPRPTLRLTLFDAIALVAGVAVGLGLSRYYLNSPMASIPIVGQGIRRFDPIYPSWTSHRGAAVVVSLVLAVLSPLIVFLDVRRGGGIRRLDLRYAGRLASVIATVVVITFFSRHLPLAARGGWQVIEVPGVVGGGTFGSPWGPPVHIDVFAAFTLPELRRWVGPLVVVGWVIQRLCCRRRRSTDAIDRLGVALGIVWTLLFVESLF
jgi:hypothetical protein